MGHDNTNNIYIFRKTDKTQMEKLNRSVVAIIWSLWSNMIFIELNYVKLVLIKGCEKRLSQLFPSETADEKVTEKVSTDGIMVLLLKWQETIDQR